MRTIVPAALALTLLPLHASAEQYTFDTHSKYVNITFESRMPIEDIVGTTHSLKGKLSGSEERGWRFELVVPVSSLRTGVDLRDEHLRSEMWLDAARHPEITFAGKEVKRLAPNRFRVKGDLTLRGVTRPLTLEVQARKIPMEQARAAGLGSEEWLRLRGDFTVRLSDFGVKIPGMAAAKVNDAWTVRLSLFARREG